MRTYGSNHQRRVEPATAIPCQDSRLDRVDSQAEWRRRFPPRPAAVDWTTTNLDADNLVEGLSAGVGKTTLPSTQRGLTSVLGWLTTYPGSTWQERWQASGAEQHRGHVAWKALAEPYLQATGRTAEYWYKDLGTGLLRLICGDAIRPSLGWLLTRNGQHLVLTMEEIRDPDGFAQLRTLLDEFTPEPRQFAKGTALSRIATLLAAKGGTVTDIVVGDCAELLDVQDVVHAQGGQGKLLFYQLLRAAGNFPTDAPPTPRVFRQAKGQLTCEELVDRYGVECRPIRDLLVDYLRERRPAVDYTTLSQISFQLVKLFWRDLEVHHPGIDSLHLQNDTAAAWKARLHVKKRIVKAPDGAETLVEERRENVEYALTVVRAFYLDIAQWAAEEPARWGPWVAPCPIRSHEISQKKKARRVKAKMDQRTRQRLPLLPTVVAIAERHRKAAEELLLVAQQTKPGETFTVAGVDYLRPAMVRQDTNKIWAKELATDRLHNLSAEEHAAFWAWAAIEVLRHTGIRIEELSELSHHSFVQYRLPTTGELVPLLQIAPSKTDSERLLLISPELADVLSTIVCRVRGENGAIPLVTSYDHHEKVWNPPMPLLFQYTHATEYRPVSPHRVRIVINEALTAAGLTGPDAQPVRLTPHDFRRMFVTDLIMNGLPPHIAQVICGHRDINTTMGYKAVYPMESIEQHRAFIARRRAIRPSEEYRTPTDEEWEEFLGHFERRKVSLGTCGRAYGTPCIHEHACVRCSMLRPDPAQRPRLIEIRDNLVARITEAEREGWLGEVEGLKVSLAGAEAKLAQLDRRPAIHLGMPDLSRVVSHTLTTPAPDPDA